jgi:hypothetical protein
MYSHIDVMKNGILFNMNMNEKSHLKDVNLESRTISL